MEHRIRQRCGSASRVDRNLWESYLRQLPPDRIVPKRRYSSEAILHSGKATISVASEPRSSAVRILGPGQATAGVGTERRCPSCPGSAIRRRLLDERQTIRVIREADERWRPIRLLTIRISNLRDPAACVIREYNATADNIYRRYFLTYTVKHSSTSISIGSGICGRGIVERKNGVVSGNRAERSEANPSPITLCDQVPTRSGRV